MDNRILYYKVGVEAVPEERLEDFLVSAAGCIGTSPAVSKGDEIGQFHVGDVESFGVPERPSGGR